MSLLNNQLNVLAVGTDTVVLSALFDHSVNLFSSAEHPCVRHQHWLHNGISYTLMPCNHQGVAGSNMQILEAGSLLLASSGVCFIAGNVRILPKQQLDELLKILETHTVAVTKKGQRTFKPPLQSGCANKTNIHNLASADESNELPFESVPLNCSVWSIYDTSFDSKSKTRETKNSKTDSILE